MKKYTFRYHSDNWVDITIAAEDQETARMLADERYNNGEYDDSDTDFENTHCDLLSEEAVEEDSPAQERKVHTCLGVFTIRGNIAIPADGDTEDMVGSEVRLPKPDMPDEAVKEFFEALKWKKEENQHIRKLLLTKISDVGVSVRTYNCLTCENIKTFADLVSFSRSEILKLPHLHKKTITEIDAMLEKMKLSFGMDLSEYDLKPKAKNVIKLAIIDHNTHTLYIDEVDEELINSKYEGEEEKYIDDVYGFDNYSWDYVISVKNNR